MGRELHLAGIHFYEGRSLRRCLYCHKGWQSPALRRDYSLWTPAAWRSPAYLYEGRSPRRTEHPFGPGDAWQSLPDRDSTPGEALPDSTATYAAPARRHRTIDVIFIHPSQTCPECKLAYTSHNSLVRYMDV